MKITIIGRQQSETNTEYEVLQAINLKRSQIWENTICVEHKNNISKIFLEWSSLLQIGHIDRLDGIYPSTCLVHVFGDICGKKKWTRLSESVNTNIDKLFVEHAGWRDFVDVHGTSLVLSRVVINANILTLRGFSGGGGGGGGGSGKIASHINKFVGQSELYICRSRLLTHVIGNVFLQVLHHWYRIQNTGYTGTSSSGVGPGSAKTQPG